MPQARYRPGLPDAEARWSYCHALSVVQQAKLEVLIGGAYAFARYTGIERHTKDLDLFIKATDLPRTLDAFKCAGYVTVTPFPHWLAKAYYNDYYVDVIFSSGNGVATVDDEWFDYALVDHVFDVPVKLCPAEEMIWSKSFVQERERFDGADVAHILRARAESLDWQRLLRRFGPHWRVLMSHLLLFGLIYPSERDRLPGWVMYELMRRLEQSIGAPAPPERICGGTLLSREQYLIDVERWGYVDARTLCDNPMTNAQIARWTEAIDEHGSPATESRHAKTERARHQDSAHQTETAAQ